MEKISSDELKDLQILSLGLDVAKFQLEKAMAVLQDKLDEIWITHKLVKDVDQLNPDGTIIRVSSVSK